MSSRGEHSGARSLHTVTTISNSPSASRSGSQPSFWARSAAWAGLSCPAHLPNQVRYTVGISAAFLRPASLPLCCRHRRRRRSCRRLTTSPRHGTTCPQTLPAHTREMTLQQALDRLRASHPAVQAAAVAAVFERAARAQPAAQRDAALTECLSHSSQVSSELKASLAVVWDAQAHPSYTCKPDICTPPPPPPPKARGGAGGHPRDQTPQ